MEKRHILCVVLMGYRAGLKDGGSMRLGMLMLRRGFSGWVLLEFGVRNWDFGDFAGE